MANERQISHRIIAEAPPYKSYIDITSDEPNIVSGSNVLSKANQIAARRGGFSDKIESGSITTFTAISREFRWSKFDGSTFLSMVNDISGGLSKVYKMQIGVDTNYALIFTSASSNPFDFAVSNNTLYMGNGTEMRKYSGSGTTTQKWGIDRPAAAPTVGTTGTGISAVAGGWYYGYTYYNSTTGHESSLSSLSTCTGNVNNKTLQITVVASADSQVDQIRIYRTTDGGANTPGEMKEISSSPVSNASTTYNDTCLDANLSATRTAPGFISNDAPTPGSKLAVYGSRIWLASASEPNKTWYSAFEENTNGVPEESFPSGIDGNFFPWPGAITSHQPMTDGVAVFTRNPIWKIEGDALSNFRRYKLLDKRGAISHVACASLGGTIAWLDTSNQVWMDGNEVGFDIRSDISAINHSTAYLAIHIAGEQHWLLLMDGTNKKVYPLNLDNMKWMTPWVLASGSTASALSSGETSSGTTVLSCAINKTQVYKQSLSTYNDAGTPYSAMLTLNLLTIANAKNPEISGVCDYIAVETDEHTNSDVKFLMDEDPSIGRYQSVFANATDPKFRRQGTELVKKLYQLGPEQGTAERLSAQLVWATTDTPFSLFTIDIAHHDTEQV